MKKMVWSVITKLCWTYFLIMELFYIYSILDTGLFNTVKHVSMTEDETALMMLACGILFIEYPVKRMKALIKRHYQELTSGQKKKKGVPIITVK